jgi:hypothetical protein
MCDEKMDEILALYTGALDADQRRRVIEELQIADSEASHALQKLQRLARSEIDIAKIPGLEDIAAWEERSERRRSEGQA